jgi:hypothetical protein
LLKALTLRSVEEAPYAFGGTETIDVERQRPDAEWDAIAAECGGDVDAWRDREPDVIGPGKRVRTPLARPLAHFHRKCSVCGAAIRGCTCRLESLHHNGCPLHLK